MTVVLETQRLQLREMVPTDLDFVSTMLADPEVTYYYERTFTRADANAWLERQLKRYSHDGHGLWLVLERGSGQPVGQVGLVMQELKAADVQKLAGFSIVLSGVRDTPRKRESPREMPRFAVGDIAR